MNKKVIIYRLLILIIFIFTWELLAKYNIINSFIFSSPTNIIKTTYNLLTKYNLLIHIFYTLIEILISFILSNIIALIISIILYKHKLLYEIIDPYLTLINSIPKVALGPLIIIWVGANFKSIILMALLTNVIISIITIYNGFINTSKIKIKLFKSYNASDNQILYNLIIPSNKKTIISSLKINISLTLIGVIMGEFLVSKHGLGYLIIYGSQIFNLNIVITSLFILIIISYIIYKIIIILNEKVS